jgi:transcriptional regulator with XRE-family HTH domain
MRAKEEIANQLGHKIRTLRIERNMTMEELALESGMDYSQLSRIERGKINTSVYQIYMISKVLNVPIHSVFKDLF